MKSVGKKKDRAWAGSPWLFWDYFYLIQKKSSVYNLGKLKNFKNIKQNIYMLDFFPSLNGSYYDLISLFINGVIFYYTETSNCGL